MRIISVAVLIILLNGLISWLVNLPQEAGPDVPQGKLNSLSFAPFREGQGPMDGVFPTAEQLDADLHLLAEKTHNIRTYASAEGTMPAIPALAQKYGLTMTQGAWLGSIDKGNKTEIEALIKAANAYPDVIKRIIVGNEVLLRGDLEPDALVKYIRQVKQSVKQPVSYADVWSMYMKYPKLIKEVDFITIHILPYWEDEPITVEQAPGHIERIYKLVQKEANAIAPGKPILIGESGWPSEGRQRGWAVPGIVNEAKFIRGLIKVANANDFDYNIVEAINQSWKSELEGVVGANWGLFSVDRKEVFPLTGEVYENPEWYKGFFISIAIFLIVAATFRKKLKNLPNLELLGLLFFLQWLICLLVNQAENLWYTSYSDWQRLSAVIMVGLNTLLSGFILQRSYGFLTRKTANFKFASWIYTIYILFVGFAIYKTFGLALNGRYISFPLVSAYIPVSGVIGLMIISYFTERRWTLKSLEFNRLVGHKNNKPRQGKIIAYIMIVGAVSLVVGETNAFLESRDLIIAYPDFVERFTLAFSFTITNLQLLQWVACLAVLGFPLLIGENKKSSL